MYFTQKHKRDIKQAKKQNTRTKLTKYVNETSLNYKNGNFTKNQIKSN